MPALVYGCDHKGQRALFGGNLRQIEGSVFDSFKIDKLAPHKGPPHIANFWHFNSTQHCAISFHDNSFNEWTIFLPSLLDRRSALELARAKFSQVMPSALTFRWRNEDETYEYD